MCRLFGDVIAARRKEGAAAAEDQHLAARTATQRDTAVVVVHDAIVILSEVHSPTAMNYAFACKCALAMD
eukprot:11671-Heterococcus_DN1.PRE.4